MELLQVCLAVGVTLNTSYKSMKNFLSNGNPVQNISMLFCFLSGPAKENEARLALSADEIVSTGKSYILVNEKQPWAIARFHVHLIF